MDQRYIKQILLKEVGEKGQEKISKAKVLCVGVGGLGVPASQYLVAAGIGKIGLVDFDRVDRSNLNRQVLYSESDQGELKTEVAKEKLTQLNSKVEIQTYPDLLSSQNVADVFSGYDIVIDGTDNFDTKYLINDYCTKMNTPWVFGALSQFEVRASLFWPEKGGGKGNCYRCLYPEPPKEGVPNCSETGILGPVAGILGSILALETLKWILSQDSPPAPFELLLNKLLVMDTQTMNFSIFKTQKNSNCTTCSFQNIGQSKMQSPLEVFQTQNLELAQKELTALMQTEHLVLIDLRSPLEWKLGRIPGSLCLNDEQLKNIHYLGKKYVFYCGVGNSSKKLVLDIKNKGILDVYSLEGGFSAWKGPLEKG